MDIACKEQVSIVLRFVDGNCNSYSATNLKNRKSDILCILYCIFSGLYAVIIKFYRNINEPL